MNRTNLFLSALLTIGLANQVSAFNIPPFATDNEVLQAINGNNNNSPPNCKNCGEGSPLDVSTGDYVQSLPILAVLGRGPALSVSLNYHSFRSHTGPFGIGWSMGYDQRLLKLTDGTLVVALYGNLDGRQGRYIRNADGSYATPPSLHNTLTENADGTWALREKTGTIRNFDAIGRMTAIIDRNGNALTFQYDNTGFLTTMTDAAGRTVKFTKGASGRVMTITDPSNRQFQFTYDANGAMTGVTDPLGNTSAMAYTSSSRLASMADPKGNILARVTYNADGTLATYTDRGETWTIAYSPSTSTTTETDSSGNRWTHVYNASGSIIRTTDPLGNSVNRSYDANGNITQVVDQNGNTIVTTFDAAGNALTVKDAMNNTITTTYDPVFNVPLTVTDRLGNVTVFAYDSKGNLIRTTDPSGNITQYQYDSNGQGTKVIDALGHSSTINYDTYGNVVTRTDALNHTSSSTFDILGNITTSTDPNGRVTQSTFDADRRLTKTIDPLGSTTTYQYDASGNLLSVTMPNGGTTTYQYDALNRVQKLTTPIGTVTTYGYDKKDNVTSRLDPNGVTTTYVYDALSRVAARSGGSDPLAYAYDKVGNLLSLRNNNTTLTYVYDADNRVIQTRTSASNFQPTTTISFTYNANGQRTAMTDPTGGVTSYSYDPAARLVSIQDPASQAFGFNYDGLLRRTGMTGPSGHTVAYSYDAAGRLSAISDQAPAGSLALSYTHDANGNILSKSDGNGSHIYGYDPLYRLISATHPAGQTTEAYAYDSVGNRTSSHLSATYTYDSANRLLADASFDYVYDNNGNLTRKTERSSGNATIYAYDSENRLVSVQVPQGTTYSYKYDGLNRRIAKLTAGNATVEYIYDGLDILSEYSGSGTLTATYTHGPGLDDVLSVRRAGLGTSFQKDQIGSIIQTFSSSGINSSIQTDSYGRSIGQVGVSQSPYSYAGREFDVESGFFYYRARYYSPDLGRFISTDPIGFGGGNNWYQYVSSNPLNSVDPFGLCDCSHILQDAEKLNNDPGYSFKGDKDTGANTNKCNAFVNDVLANTGVAPQRPKTWFGLGGGGPISAGTWADPNANIPNFPVVSDPKPGDIVAVAFNYADASGHVAIVKDPGKSSIGAGSHEGSHTTGWPWDPSLTPQGTPTYRRCTCGQ
jgi:RHS repeat-associated protein